MDTTPAQHPASGAGPAWQVPRLWRGALAISGMVVAPFCRLRVTGDVPVAQRSGPLILAANHIGSFDPFILTAACAKRGLAPRIMATGGLFRAPVIGPMMRTAGHIRVDRRRATVVDALDAAAAAVAAGSVVLGYPEGRITLDPGMWPERGKSGLARLAIASGAPVVAVAQWGAQTILPWGAPKKSLRRVFWAILHRPIVRVHFGPAFAVDGDQSARSVRLGTDRIMDEIVAALRPLRTDEPRIPRWIDPVRPVSATRTHRTNRDNAGEARPPE